MDISELSSDKIDEAALALLRFGFHSDVGGVRTWKDLSWEIMNRLHEKGWIGDPRNKNRSVIVMEEGERLAEEFARKLFGPDA